MEADNIQDRVLLRLLEVHLSTRGLTKKQRKEYERLSVFYPENYSTHRHQIDKFIIGRRYLSHMGYNSEQDSYGNWIKVQNEEKEETILSKQGLAAINGGLLISETKERISTKRKANRAFWISVAALLISLITLVLKIIEVY